jgi:hypothetical protein
VPIPTRPDPLTPCQSLPSGTPCRTLAKGCSPLTIVFCLRRRKLMANLAVMEMEHASEKASRDEEEVLLS